MTSDKFLQSSLLKQFLMLSIFLFSCFNSKIVSVITKLNIYKFVCDLAIVH